MIVHPKSAVSLILCALVCGSGIFPAPVGAQDEKPGDAYTWHRDIVPVFQSYCIDCHHAGGPTPQSLETYESARSWLRASRRMMSEKSMPPWHAKPGVGEWRNAELPTDEEIQMVVDWVDAGAPEGDPADAPEPLDFSQPWRLGDPDRVLEAPEAVEVPAQGQDFYRTWTLDPGFGSDTWLSGIELKPAAPKQTVSLTLAAVPPDVAASYDPDAFDFDTTRPGKYYLAHWNKGLSLIENFPEDTGVLVPAGWQLLLQAHYRPKDEAGSGTPSVGLHLADAPPAMELKTFVVETRKLDIPEFAYDFAAEASRTIDSPIAIHSIFPLMHYVATSAEVTATPPGESPLPLLAIDRYDAKIQTVYVPAEPIEIPAGAEVTVRAWFNNSPDNPNNPNVMIEPIGYGPAPGGEMLKAVFQYVEG